MCAYGSYGRTFRLPQRSARIGGQLIASVMPLAGQHNPKVSQSFRAVHADSEPAFGTKRSEVQILSPRFLAARRPKIEQERRERGKESP
jgi:hypothetical protein